MSDDIDDMTDDEFEASGAPVDLASAATDALDAVGGGDGAQGVLDGTNLAKVKFNGMGFEATEVPGLKEEVEFRVKGTVVDVGQRVMADGHIRDYATVQVESVVREIP